MSIARPEQQWRAGRVFAVIGLAFTTVAILLITMWPNPVDQGAGSFVLAILDALHRLGIPEAFGYDQLEFTANIVMFMPFGMFLGLVWRRLILGSVLVTLFTVAIELTQYFFIVGRYGTVLDVVANSLGGWIGLALAAALTMCRHRKPPSTHKS